MANSNSVSTKATVKGLAKRNRINGFAQRDTRAGSGSILLDLLDCENLQIMTTDGPISVAAAQVKDITISVSDIHGELNEALQEFSSETSLNAATVTLNLDGPLELVTLTMMSAGGVQKPQLQVRTYLGDAVIGKPPMVAVPADQLQALLAQGQSAARTLREGAYARRAAAQAAATEADAEIAI